MADPNAALQQLDQWLQEHKAEAGSALYVRATQARDELAAKASAAPAEAGGGSRVPVPGETIDTSEPSTLQRALGPYGPVQAIARPIVKAETMVGDLGAQAVNTVADWYDRFAGAPTTERFAPDFKVGPIPENSAWASINRTLATIPLLGSFQRSPEEMQAAADAINARGGRLPTVSGGVLSAAGAAPVTPEDASRGQKAFEYILQAVYGGRAGLSRGLAEAAPGVAAGTAAVGRSLVKDVALPVGLSEAGSRGAEAAAEAVAPGDELAARTAGLVGGVAAPFAGPKIIKPLATMGTERYYGTEQNVRPDAAEVAAAYERAGAKAPWGVLTEGPGQLAEKNLIGTSPVQAARDAAVAAMQKYGQGTVEAARELPPTTPDNAGIVSAVQQMRDIGQPGGPAAEQILANRIGGATANVRPIAEEWGRLYEQNALQGKALEPQLTPMFNAVPVDPQTGMMVSRQIPGTPPAPPGLTPQQVAQYYSTVTEVPVRYSQMAGARTALGARLPGSEGMVAGTRGAMYDALTRTMEEAATRPPANQGPGIPLDTVRQVHEIYANEQRANRIADLLARTIGTGAQPGLEKAPGSRMLANELAKSQREGDYAREYAGTGRPTGDVTGRLNDLLLMAEAGNYPTRQGGLSISLGDLLTRGGGAALSGVLGSLLAGMKGGVLGNVVGSAAAAIPEYLRYERGRMLESDMARRGLLGQYSRFGDLAANPKIQDLVMALQSAGVLNRGYEP